MNQDQLDLQVAELESKIKQATGAGDYTAAKQFQTQITQLKESFKIDVLAELQAEHEQYVRAIDEAYAEEELSFNAQWERRLDGFNQAATGKMNEMKDELQQKLQKLEDMYRAKPVRFSSQVIGLRDQESRLAKNGRFDEAKAVQRQADEMEQDEIQQHRLVQQQFRDQQKLELYRFYEKQSRALMTKIEAGRADIISKWSGDMDKLDKHHEAMLRAEEIRFTKSRGQKTSNLAMLSSKTAVNLSQIKSVQSPVQQYIKQEGAKVDASQLGSSMGPVISKFQGLGRLK